MERGEEGEVCRRGRRVRVVQYVSRHEPARRMSDESSSFYQLDERIQRFLWIEGWESLRDAQELAIPLILGGERDVIVSAATASGKTEAAFLPALTHLLHDGGDGVIVYISPLKALINDQFGRLQRLCENLEVPVWPWHGDITRPEERRGGKEGVSTCRSRRSPYHLKKQRSKTPPQPTTPITNIIE